MPTTSTNLQAAPFDIGRRTTADEVFEVLHGDIVSLRLLPGAKLSEVDVAGRMDVSRQPVREAFIRLDELGLLQVRPQRATLVRRFSRAAIAHARFVRGAIEIEVLREACAAGTATVDRSLDLVLERQHKALQGGRTERFHELDHEFHHLICRAAGRDPAFDTISAYRVETDRLCLLSLGKRAERELVLDDHVRMTEHLRAGHTHAAVERLRVHLSRLDAVIDAVHARHPEYFIED